jgi:hypothetical protein
MGGGSAALFVAIVVVENEEINLGRLKEKFDE